MYGAVCYIHDMHAVTVFVFYFARLWIQLTRLSEFVVLTSGNIRGLIQ